jgi:DNA-binding IclR family transcriptional regulator
MSKTLLRGLDLIEEVGRQGPLTVSELARLTGVHISIVSRTVGACEPEGWLTRVDGKISTGPRCAILGMTSAATPLIRAAEPLVAAIAGVTGLVTAASALVGSDLMILASSGDSGTASLPDGLLSRVPVHLLAAGRAIAVQLEPAQLEAVLPPEPYPDIEELLGSHGNSTALAAYLASFQPPQGPPDGLSRTRAELDVELASIRATGLARDRGGVHPAIHCIAVPWPAGILPASLNCLGSREAIEGGAGLIERVLRAGARAGAGAEDVVAAAAGVSG